MNKGLPSFNRRGAPVLLGGSGGGYTSSKGMRQGRFNVRIARIVNGPPQAVRLSRSNPPIVGCSFDESLLGITKLRHEYKLYTAIMPMKRVK